MSVQNKRHLSKAIKPTQNIYNQQLSQSFIEPQTINSSYTNRLSSKTQNTRQQYFAIAENSKQSINYQFSNNYSQQNNHLSSVTEKRSRPQSSRPLLLGKQRQLRERDSKVSLMKNDYSPEIKSTNKSPANNESSFIYNAYGGKTIRNGRPLTAQNHRKVGSQQYYSKHQNQNSMSQLSFLGTPLKVTNKSRTRAQSAKKRPLTAVQSRGRKNFLNMSNDNTYNPVDNISIDVQMKLNEQKIRNKKTISEFTYCENNEINDTILKLQMIEKMKQEKDQPYKNIENINCKELIQKANRDIKNLNYQIQRIVATEENNHTVVQNKRSQDLEIIEQSLMYFKVPSKGFSSPVKIYVEIKETELTRGKKQDLKMYVSLNSKEPNDHDYQKYFNTFLKPNFFSSPNKEKFTHDFVYFSLFSITGCSINIQFIFAEENMKSKHKINIEEDGTFEEKRSFRLNRDIDDMSEDQDPYQQRDFMGKNVREVANWEDAVVEKQRRNIDQMEKIVQARQRQKDLELQNLKRKYFLLHKWEIIKVKRQQYEQIVTKMKKQRNFKKRWIKQMKIHMIAKHIFDVFAIKQKQVITELRQNYTVRRVGQLFRRYTSRIAIDRKHRAQKRIANVFSYTVSQTYDTVEQRATKIIRSLLQETSEIHHIKVQLRVFYNKMLYIQSKVRERILSFKYRCDVIKDLWDKEKAGIIKDCITKKTKKKTLLMKKLNLMHDDIKTAMIEAYLERCKLKYQLIFAEWRLHTKYPVEDQQLQKQRENMVYKIIKKKDRLFAVESLLFSGIDFDADVSANSPVKQNPIQAPVQNGQRKTIVDSKNSSKPAMNANPRSKSASVSQGKQIPKPLPQVQSKTNILEKVQFLLDEPPIFKFIPKKEILKKLITKATTIKHAKELKL
ncbi:UNKNOWN [Stylonychia lemnae]|uniref:Uncharacterized protein n=1 Tax=Stylonychia lemnae TaxID=5949 RepID=A0A078B1H1_STYLE|nr:UNKNOWN [Stylonychia lemnae]|eukprot:CDW87083.1 UNKNOWN [Stylonychia lemnae]